MTEINALANTTIPAKTLHKMRQAADDFESFYLYQVMELMVPEVDKDAMFSGGFGEEMFQHELNKEIANAITDRGGIGISDHIFNQLVKLQEMQQ
ncbi:MAG: rod-binding protein [Alphaproteobacteria bacterium]|nr:rod-binding protein [Alphaproteobacteria bacterium]MDD9919337.1 rod-binding protein [Alphaproteobacteria bacterium]